MRILPPHDAEPSTEVAEGEGGRPLELKLLELPSTRGCGGFGGANEAHAEHAMPPVPPPALVPRAGCACSSWMAAPAGARTTRSSCLMTTRRTSLFKL